MLTAQLPQPLQEEFERTAQLLHNGDGVQRALIEAIELWLSQQQKSAESETQQMKDLRPFALCTGVFRVPADFEDPLPNDLLEAFEGR